MLEYSQIYEDGFAMIWVERSRMDKIEGVKWWDFQKDLSMMGTAGSIKTAVRHNNNIQYKQRRIHIIEVYYEQKSISVNIFWLGCGSHFFFVAV